MKRFSRDQFSFVLSILEQKDKDHKLELVREQLKNSSYLLLQDHPRYGELISICPQYKVK